MSNPALAAAAAAALAFSTAALAAAPATPTGAAADAIRAACTRTVHGYARAWDTADGAAFGALFTENA